MSEGSLEAASASTACMQSSRDLRHLRREKRTSLDCPLRGERRKKERIRAAQR